MATYTDDFDRADSNSLGANWTESETAITNLRIVSNELETYVDINDGGLAQYNATVADDQYSQAVYRGIVSNATLSGPAVRLSGTVSSGSGYGVVVDLNSATEISLIKWVSEQIHTQNGTELANITRSMTVGEVVRIEAEGTTIRVLIDDTEVISVTDADVSSGNVGMANPIFNFAAPFRGRWDDWEGGDLTVIPSDSGSLGAQVVDSPTAVRYNFVSHSVPGEII